MAHHIYHTWILCDTATAVTDRPPEASQSAATEPGAHGAVAKAGASPGACQKVFGPGPEVDFDGGLICLMVDSWCLLEVNGVEWCLMVFNGTGYGYYEWC